MFIKTVVTSHPEYITGPIKEWNLFGSSPSWLEIPNFSVEEVSITTIKEGGMRGMQVQLEVPQPRIVKVVEGKIKAVIVNCNIDSENVGEISYTESSSEDGSQIYIPEKFAFGYQASKDSKILTLFGGESIISENDGFNLFSKEIKNYWNTDHKKANMVDDDRKLPEFVDFIGRVAASMDPRLW